MLFGKWQLRMEFITSGVAFGVFALEKPYHRHDVGIFSAIETVQPSNEKSFILAAVSVVVVQL
jgi:hypothetical protein